jgi:lysyl-tRNA synthetase class 2
MNPYGLRPIFLEKNMSAELSGNEYRQQRIENMNKLEQAGFPAFGKAFERTARLDELHASFEEGRTAKACGRIVAMRQMGKMAFAHISDGSSKFQLMVKKDVLSEESFNAFKLLDLGDIIGVEGEMFITRTEEQTLRISDWCLLSKALLPLPEKFHGLTDVETRYRQRSLDLISNPEVMDVFKKRTWVMKGIRAFLDGRGYYEVETPMLQQIAGGAAAKPFMAHYNALNIDVFMRIAPELYLKRLIVGGMDRVYEMNRNFRNEGLDRTQPRIHLPRNLPGLRRHADHAGADPVHVHASCPNHFRQDGIRVDGQHHQPAGPVARSAIPRPCQGTSRCRLV